MNTTMGMTQYDVIAKVLESNYGKRVPLTKILHPFVNDHRKTVGNHTSRISTYRKNNPGMTVTCKKIKERGIFKTWYMLHEEGDGLEEKPLQKRKTRQNTLQKIGF